MNSRSREVILLYTDETPPGVLHQIGYPQNRGLVGLLEHMHPEEGHKSDLRNGPESSFSELNK